MGPEKLLILALLVALVFGAGAVPAIGRRAGKGIREARDALGIDEMREEISGVRSSLTGGAEGDSISGDSAPAGEADSARPAQAKPTPPRSA